MIRPTLTTRALGRTSAAGAPVAGVQLVLALVLALSAGLLLPTLGAAQAVPRPEPGPAPDLSFPHFIAQTLDNGLTVVIVEHHEQPAVSVRLMVPAGRLYEPADSPGLVQAVTSLLDQGTATRSAQEIAEAIDFVGGSLDTGGGDDFVLGTVSVTSDQLDLALDLLSDVMLRPSFPEEELQRWRTRTLAGLQVNLTDPAFLAGAAFDRVVFGDHPYGRPASGTPETVEALTRQQVVDYHRATFVPNGSFLAVVGDVAPRGVMAAVRKAFGGWQKGTPPTAPAIDAQLPEKMHVLVLDKPDAVQTQVRVGQLALAHKDPDLFAGRLYNAVVGGGVSARLYEEIRRKRGLSYGAGSGLQDQLVGGVFRAQTFTKTETTVEVLSLVLGVLDGMEKELVPVDELDGRKRYLTGVFPLEIETPNGIASRVLESLMYGRGRAYLDSYRDQLNAITPEQLREFARKRIHPERAVVVLAGDASGFLEELKATLGERAEIEVIPFADVDLLREGLRRPPVDQMAVDQLAVDQLPVDQLAVESAADTP